MIAFSPGPTPNTWSCGTNTSVEIGLLFRLGAVVITHQQPVVVYRVIEMNPFRRAIEECNLHGFIEIRYEAIDGDLKPARPVGCGKDWFVSWFARHVRPYPVSSIADESVNLRVHIGHLRKVLRDGKCCPIYQ
ncbi:hypothetical protein [Phyllobacterium zundukense]|uniref:Uncharacterized protein n=1 Tax=Phyllobacterium zundukense TaxID=1867719 RepID=A0ACD4CYB7_9HYPH|nr:hypothetical protein [Phyllobacterium zundukense]UXN58626.1 hypothetical protein N8E88_11570 [Phyllobacterium zundukense]